MALVHQLILDNLPARRRQTPKGWITFNAPCCSHRGHKADRRGRGNLMMGSDGVIGYNCYNCGFKTKFDGVDLSHNFENLLVWIGAPPEGIKAAKLELLRLKLDGVTPDGYEAPAFVRREFKEVPLPTGAVRMESVPERDEIPPSFLRVLSYLTSRGAAVAENHDYHWSPDIKHAMRDRLIIPFYHGDKVVGWTARYAGEPPKGVPRYYNSELQPGYLFNHEVMDDHVRRYVLLVEGSLDAIAIDGVAALGAELTPEQLAWLRGCDKEIIVVPDRQRSNQGLIDVALAQGWHVSFPEWEDDVKDAAQASARYGRIYTIRSIISSRTNSALEIDVKRQMFRMR